MRRLAICALAACTTQPPAVVQAPSPPPAPAPREAAVAEVAMPGHDLDGDTLPAGASARLGSLHLRHRNGATVLAYSPDGMHVATADIHDVTIWSLATGKPDAQLGDGYASLETLAYSPDGKLLVGADRDARGVRAWRASGGVAWELDTANNGIMDIAWSPDGTRIAFAGEMHMMINNAAGPTIGLFLADAATGSLVRDYSASEKRPVQSVAWSPGGQTLAYARPDAIVLVSPATGKVRATLHEIARVIRFAPDGKSLFVIDSKLRLERLDVRTGRSVPLLATHVYKLALSPDGTRLAVSGEQGVFLVDVATGAIRKLARSEGYVVAAPAFSADGRQLTQPWGTQKLSLQPTTWNVETGEIVAATDHRAAIVSVACSGDTIASADTDGQVILWDLDGHERARLPARTSAVNEVRFSADGKRLLLPGTDKTIVIWDVARGASTVLAGHANGVESALWLGDGRIASAGYGELFVWRDGQIDKRLPVAETTAIGPLALAPDGATLAAAGGATQLWKVGTFANPITIGDGEDDGSTAIAFSPDGKAVLVAGPARLIVADTSGHVTSSKPDVQTTFTGVAFAPDGAWFLAIGEYRSGIYSFPARKPRAPLGNELTTGAVCPDGKRVVTASPDGTAIVWSVDALLREARP